MRAVKGHKVFLATHDGMQLYLGVDILGLHLMMLRTPKKEDPEEQVNLLNWDVELFPLELYEIIQSIMGGKETFGSFSCGNIVGHVKEIVRGKKIEISLGDIENGWNFPINLNGDELRNLQDTLKTHFCY